MNRRSFIKSGLIYVPALVLPHDRVRSSGFLPVPSIDGEVYRWAFSRVIGQASSISSATLMKVDAYMAGLRSYGLRSQIQRMNLYVGKDFNALTAPFINDSGSSTDALNNFVAGDYSETTGLTGNGSTKWINTNIAQPVGNANDRSMGLYVRNHSTSASVSMGHAETATAYYLLPGYGGVSYFSCGNSGAQLSFADATSAIGMYIGSRTSASSVVLYKDAVSKASGSDGSNGNFTGNLSLVIHAENDNVFGVNQYTARTLEMYFVGYGLTATQVTNLTNLYATLRTALGR